MWMMVERPFTLAQYILPGTTSVKMFRVYSDWNLNHGHASESYFVLLEFCRHGAGNDSSSTAGRGSPYTKPKVPTALCTSESIKSFYWYPWTEQCYVVRCTGSLTSSNCSTSSMAPSLLFLFPLFTPYYFPSVIQQPWKFFLSFKRSSRQKITFEIFLSRLISVDRKLYELGSVWYKNRNGDRWVQFSKVRARGHCKRMVKGWSRWERCAPYSGEVASIISLLIEPMQSSP